MNKEGILKNPVATVDIIIEIPYFKNNYSSTAYTGVVIIERKNKPFGLALPGGFVDEWEYLWHAAIREAKEEVSLDIELVEQFYVYSGPKRDARLSAVSTVFIATASGEPVAADDAKKVSVVPIQELLEMAQAGAFVFDHNEIIQDYIYYKKTSKRPGSKR